MQSHPARDDGDAFAVRSVSQWERALLAQWFAGTDRDGPQAIVAAYVSDRSHDDPRLRNMIVIGEHARTDMAFLIYRPIGEIAWTLDCGRTGNAIGRYRTLPEALNVIRPNRGADETLPATESAAFAVRLVDASSGR